MTSDDYLSNIVNKKDVFQVTFEFEKTMMEKLSKGGASLFNKVLTSLSKSD